MNAPQARFEVASRMGSGAVALAWLDTLPADIDGMLGRTWGAEGYANTTVTDHRTGARRIVAGNDMVPEEVRPVAGDEE
jgi:hypothetical protein